MRDKKTVILMIIALSLLAAGCSTGAKEKSGNLKKVERMETEKILTVDELIRLSGITEADYRDVDLQQFIEDYAIT